MKKQNIIILSVFVLIISCFYLISCNNSSSEESIVTNLKQEETSDYVDIYLMGQFERCGSFKVPRTWTLEELFHYGGVKAGADLSDFDLNLAVESNKVYYVFKMGDAYNNYDKKININTANLEELKKLDGIGEGIALRIIAYRQEYPFTSVEEIKNVSGIGNEIYKKIRDFITV